MKKRTMAGLGTVGGLAALGVCAALLGGTASTTQAAQISATPAPTVTSTVTETVPAAPLPAQTVTVTATATVTAVHTVTATRTVEARSAADEESESSADPDTADGMADPAGDTTETDVPASDEQGADDSPASFADVDPGASSGPFANCSEARAAGAAPLYRGQPGYARKLDRDHDGVACE